MLSQTVAATLVVFMAGGIQIALAASNRSLLSNGDTIKLFPTTSYSSPSENYCERDTLATEKEDAATIEPILRFEKICDPLVGYSGLYRKHRLVFPISINASRSSQSDWIVVGINVSVEDSLAASLQGADAKSSVKLFAQIKTQSSFARAQLVFLCSDFARCNQLKESIEIDPQELWLSIRFAIKLKATKRPFTVIQFDNLQTVNHPESNCDSKDNNWIVFQRRVDGSLSFAKNWDAYVNGFGHPESNYWMGLDRLFHMTATGKKSSYHDTSRCRLRIEVRDFKGTKYQAEYGLFQVLDPAQNYVLRIGLEAPNSQISGFVAAHNELPFSTYDRTNDRLPGDSCSKLYGYGGWWYGNCHLVNLNGAYLTNPNVTDSPVYASIRVASKFVPLKFTEMKFKCG